MSAKKTLKRTVITNEMPEIAGHLNSLARDQLLAASNPPLVNINTLDHNTNALTFFIKKLVCNAPPSKQLSTIYALKYFINKYNATLKACVPELEGMPLYSAEVHENLPGDVEIENGTKTVFFTDDGQTNAAIITLPPY